MPITQWNTNFKADYSTDLINLLKLEENQKLLQGDLTKLSPYYDTSIAIGYGFDLLVHSDAQINAFFASIGRPPLTLPQAQLLDANRYSCTASTLQQVAAQLGQLGLNLDSEANATSLLVNYINTVAEKDVDRFLAANGLTMPPSKERIALVSLAYNNPHLLGAGLALALKSPDPYDARAEAWFEIRYNSNGGHDKGIATRRYGEAATFGLQ